MQLGPVGGLDGARESAHAKDFSFLRKRRVEVGSHRQPGRGVPHRTDHGAAACQFSSTGDSFRLSGIFVNLVVALKLPSQIPRSWAPRAVLAKIRSNLLGAI
jgi:hypothetical protein